MPGKDWLRDRGQKESGKSQKAGSGCSGRTRPYKQGIRPAMQKAPHRTESSTQVNILTTCFGNSGAQFRVAKCPPKGRLPRL